MSQKLQKNPVEKDGEGAHSIHILMLHELPHKNLNVTNIMKTHISGKRVSGG
jgi:hypothetical protein